MREILFIFSLTNSYEKKKRVLIKNKSLLK